MFDICFMKCYAFPFIYFKLLLSLCLRQACVFDVQYNFIDGQPNEKRKYVEWRRREKKILKYRNNEYESIEILKFYFVFDEKKKMNEINNMAVNIY